VVNRWSFQSPCGVLGVCRQVQDDRERAVEAVVSVPLRGFRGLQACIRDAAPSVRVRGFQSPCGVLGVCRTALNIATQDFDLTFQSPCGVLGVCRSGSRNPPGWCGCLTRPGFLIPRAV